MTEWRPLGQAEVQTTTLHEDVPPWAEGPIWRWIDDAMTTTSASSSDPLIGMTNYSRWNWDWIEEFDIRLQLPVPLARLASDTRTLQRALDAAYQAPSEITILFLDFLVWKNSARMSGRSRVSAQHFQRLFKRLEEILHISRIAWTVGTRDGHAGLERRVPEAVQKAAELAMDAPGHAGTRLSEAWHAVFGVNPNPAHAYATAVKAVEDATIPLLVPKQSNANLGHVVGQLKNDGDWGLPLTREHQDAPTGETIIRMLQGLWKGHHDRHGGDASAPKSVSQEEAETAVMLAVPLVQWFSSGAAARR